MDKLHTTGNTWGPAVERRKTLVACAGTAAAVPGAIGPRAMPCHTNEQPAIMAPVSRPPVLRIRHQRVEVLFQRGVVQFRECFRIVEIRPQRIRCRCMLVQQVRVQLVRPPVAIGTRTGHRLRALHSGERAFLFIRHGFLRGSNRSHSMKFHFMKIVSHALLNFFYCYDLFLLFGCAKCRSRSRRSRHGVPGWRATFHARVRL